MGDRTDTLRWQVGDVTIERVEARVVVVDIGTLVLGTHFPPPTSGTVVRAPGYPGLGAPERELSH